MKTTPSFTKTQKLDIKATDFVYLDIESPVDYNRGTQQAISSLGYTDGRFSILEYIKFSKDCKVTDVMTDVFNSPPSEVYKKGRQADEALKDLERFANGRPIIVFGEFDKKLLNLEINKFDLDLNFNLIDFKNSIVTPTKHFTLSVSRLVEILDIQGDYTNHNPLDDALKLKAIHETYEDTPEFRRKAFDFYMQTELNGILKMANSGVTRVTTTYEKYLSESVGVTTNFQETLLDELTKILTTKETV